MAGNDDLALNDTDRSKLDGIVQQMTTNKESDANIQFVVNDFKQKYAKPSSQNLTTQQTNTTNTASNSSDEKKNASPDSGTTSAGQQITATPSSKKSGTGYEWTDTKVTTPLAGKVETGDPDVDQGGIAHLERLTQLKGAVTNNIPIYQALNQKVVDAHVELNKNAEYKPIQQLGSLIDKYNNIDPKAKDAKAQQDALKTQIDAVRNKPVSPFENSQFSGYDPSEIGSNAGISLLHQLVGSQYKTYGEMYDASVGHQKTIADGIPLLNKLFQQIQSDKTEAQQLSGYTGKQMGVGETFMHSFGTGMDNIVSAIAVHGASDADKVDFYKRKAIADNVIFPKEEAPGVAGYVASSLGSVAPLAAATVLGGATAGPMGAIAMGSLTMGLGEQNQGGYEGFQEAKGNGMNDADALAYSKKMSAGRATMGVVLGAVLPGAGELGEKWLLNSVEKTAFTKFWAQNMIMAPLFGANQMTQNVMANYVGNGAVNRGVLDHTTEAVGGAVALSAMMDVLHHAATGEGTVLADTKSIFEMAWAKRLPEAQATVTESVNKGVVDQETGNKIMKGIQEKADALAMMPSGLTPEQQVVVQPYFTKLYNLLADKQIDKTEISHPGIDNEIQKTIREAREKVGMPLSPDEQLTYGELKTRTTEKGDDGKVKKPLTPIEQVELDHLQTRLDNNSVEKDKGILDTQGKNNLPTSPELNLTEAAKGKLAQIDNGEITTNNTRTKTNAGLQPLVDELNKKIDVLTKTKDNPNRQFTTGQIDATITDLKNKVDKIEAARNSDGVAEPLSFGEKPVKVGNVDVVDHGEDTATAAGLSNGQTATDLTDEGKKQAEQKGIDFAKTNPNLKTIYHSPIERAVQTAIAAAKSAGEALGREVYSKAKDFLKTWDIGNWADTPKNKFDEKYYVDHPDQKAGGGESFNDFKDRAIKAWEWSKKLPDDAAVITHSKIQKMFDALNATDGEWNDKAKEIYLKGTDAGKQYDANAKEVVKEIQSKPLTHAVGVGMGSNEMEGTYLSTEDGNRYGRNAKDVVKAEANLKNPYVLKDSAELTSLQNDALQAAKEAYLKDNPELKQSGMYADFMAAKTHDADVLSAIPDFQKYVAKEVSDNLKSRGYDSAYLRADKNNEGMLVVFNKDNVKLENGQPAKSNARPIITQAQVKEQLRAKRAAAREAKGQTVSTKGTDAMAATNEYKKATKDFEPVSIHEMITQFFATGGKINSIDFARDVFAKGTSEYKDSKFHNSDGVSLDRLAMQFAESWKNDHGGDVDTQEIHKEILDILNSKDQKSVREEILKTQADRQFAEENSGASKQQIAEAQSRLEEDERVKKATGVGDEEDKSFDQTDKIEITKSDKDAAKPFIDKFRDKDGNVDWEAVQKAADDPFSEHSDLIPRDLLPKFDALIQDEKANTGTGNKNVAENTDSKSGEEERRDQQASLDTAKEGLNKATSLYEGLKKRLTADQKSREIGMGLEKTKGKQISSGLDTEALTKELAEAKTKMDEARAVVDKLQKVVDDNPANQQKLFGIDKAKEGLNDLLDAFKNPTGGLAILGPKHIDALAKIGEGLIEAGQATVDNVMEKIKDYLKGSSATLNEQDLKDSEPDIVQRISDNQNRLKASDVSGLSDAERAAKLKEQLTTNREVNNKSLADRVKNSKLFKGAAEAIRAFHPLFTDMGRKSYSILREHFDKYENSLNKFSNESKKRELDWAKVPEAERMLFIDKLQSGEKQSTPELQHLADLYNKLNDTAYDEVSKVKDVDYISNYMAQMWQDKGKAQTFFSDFFSKNPLEGSKSFLKQRYYDSYRAGIESGLVPEFTNPEKLVQVTFNRAMRLKMANDVFTNMAKELGPDKGMTLVMKGESPPEGYAPVNDPLWDSKAASTASGIRETGRAADKAAGIETQPVKAGQDKYYAPNEVASVVNNFTSSGVENLLAKSFISGARGVNALFNMFQLGWSPFHAFMTSTYASRSALGLGIDRIGTGVIKLARGDVSSAADNFKNGIKDVFFSGGGFALSPQLVKNYIDGYQLKNQLKTGIDNANTDLITRGGGRAQAHAMYQMDAFNNLKFAINELKSGDNNMGAVGKIAGNTILTAIEAGVKPIMDYHVPFMKLSGFMDEAKREIERLGPDASERDKTIALQKAWDSMDNRFGQLNYDHLAWDKSTKQITTVAARALGWTKGSLDEAVRGVAGDEGIFGKGGNDFLQGKGMTPKMRFVVGHVAGAMLTGMMYQYIRTGQLPQELKDYFFPKDGSKNTDGTDHRVSPDAYTKDYYNWLTHPVTTAENKIAPGFETLNEIWQNKDFYGGQIRAEDATVPQQFSEIGKYLAKQAVPFAFRTQTGSLNKTQQVEQAVGIQAAPRPVQLETDKQKAIYHEATNQFEQVDKPRTQEEMLKYQALRDLRAKITLGQNYTSDLKTAKDKGYLTDRNTDKFISDSKINYFNREYKNFPSERQLKVLKQLGPDDRKGLLKFTHKPSVWYKLQREKPELFQDEDSKKIFDMVMK